MALNIISNGAVWGAWIGTLVLAVTPGMSAQVFTVGASDAEYATIQSAIDAASDGDIIHIAPGRYGDDSDGDGWIADLGRKQLTIMPDPRYGDGEGSVEIDVAASDSQNGGFLCAGDQGADTVIQGLKFQGPNSPDQPDGVGLKAVFAHPSIIECTFTRCRKGVWNIGDGNMPGNAGIISACDFISNGDGSNDGDGSAPGICIDAEVGGMVNQNVSPAIHGCRFEANHAMRGAAIANNNSSPVIQDCTFVGNEAWERGGAIYNGPNWSQSGLDCVKEGGSHPTITRCEFRENIARLGGAIAGEHASPTINDCMFDMNRTTETHEDEHGGAVYCTDGSPVFDDCTFESNYADEGGGAVFFQSSTPSIYGCTFRRNIANRIHGGGIWLVDGGAEITDCSFVENKAVDGGGIHLSGDYSKVKFCYFARNEAMVWGGGAVTQSDDVPGSGAEFDRCVFLANSSNSGGGLHINALATNGQDPGICRVYGCSFLHNKAKLGGGVEIAHEQQSPIDAIFERCFFYGNHATDGAEESCQDSGNPSPCAYGGGAYIDYAYTTFGQCLFLENTSDGDGGGIDINVDYGTHRVCDSRLDRNISGLDDDDDDGAGVEEGTGDAINSRRCFAQFDNTSICDGQSVVASDCDTPIESIDSCSACMSLTGCPGDLNMDMVIDGADLTLLLGNWGSEVKVPRVPPTSHPEPSCELDYLPCATGYSLDCKGTCFPVEVIQALEQSACKQDGSYIPADHGWEDCPEGVAIFLNCIEFDCGREECLVINPEWYGQTRQTLLADINRDGVIDGEDLTIILGNWGECP